MNRVLSTASVAAFLLSATCVLSAEPKLSSRALMQSKIEHSREVLAGLCVEDFGRIAANARSLTQITEEQWIGVESEQYRMHLKNFRFATAELERLANEKNMDGASLAYLQMTMSCIDCHKHLRRREK